MTIFIIRSYHESDGGIGDLAMEMASAFSLSGYVF